jgi:undecaprenyl-diphosphatase
MSWPVLLRLAFGGLVLIALGAALGAPLAAASPIAWEVDALVWFAERRADPVTAVMRTFTLIADFWVVLGGALVIAVIAWRLTRHWESAWLVGLTLFGSLGVTGFIKLATDRLRPDEGLVSVLSSSFPSGHTVRATAIYGLIAWAIWRGRWPRAVRVLVVVVAGTVVVGVGVSRMYLAVHWPTDVLFGHLVGGVWLAVVVWTLRLDR